MRLQAGLSSAASVQDLAAREDGGVAASPRLPRKPPGIAPAGPRTMRRSVLEPEAAARRAGGAPPAATDAAEARTPGRRWLRGQASVVAGPAGARLSVHEMAHGSRAKPRVVQTQAKLLSYVVSNSLEQTKGSREKSTIMGTISEYWQRALVRLHFRGWHHYVQRTGRRREHIVRQVRAQRHASQYRAVLRSWLTLALRAARHRMQEQMQREAQLRAAAQIQRDSLQAELRVVREALRQAAARQEAADVPPDITTVRTDGGTERAAQEAVVVADEPPTVAGLSERLEQQQALTALAQTISVAAATALAECTGAIREYHHPIMVTMEGELLRARTAARLERLIEAAEAEAQAAALAASRPRSGDEAARQPSRDGRHQRPVRSRAAGGRAAASEFARSQRVALALLPSLSARSADRLADVLTAATEAAPPEQRARSLQSTLSLQAFCEEVTFACARTAHQTQTWVDQAHLLTPSNSAALAHTVAQEVARTSKTARSALEHVITELAVRDTAILGLLHMLNLSDEALAADHAATAAPAPLLLGAGPTGGSGAPAAPSAAIGRAEEHALSKISEE